MAQALRQLAEDFLSAILFFIVYAGFGHHLGAAVAVGAAVGLAQIARKKWAGQPVQPMQWMSLALVIVLGAATLALQSPRLMMLKPSIIQLAVAAVMLRRGWLRRYLPPFVQQNLPEAAIVGAGYGWAALLAGLALANLFIVARFDIVTWGWFVSVGALGAKAAAFAVQYVVFRTLIRRRLRLAFAAAPAEVKVRLQDRARQHGRSLEAEIRAIVRDAANAEELAARVGAELAARFAGLNRSHS